MARTVAERFWTKVDGGPAVEGHWYWLGYIGPDGRGRMRVGGTVRNAAAVAHELLVGPVPEGFLVVVTCEVPHCVSMFHLEARSLSEQRQRRWLPDPRSEEPGSRFPVPGGRGAHNAAKTCCPEGHPYDEANTYVTKQGTRRCRTCRRVKARG